MTDTFRDFITNYYKRIPNQVVDPYIISLQKTTDPMTFSGSTTWFDPVYLGKLMLEGLTRSTKMFKAITKTTYQQEGDSYQVIGADVAAADGALSILETGNLFTTYDTPDVTDVDQIYPAILKVSWRNTDVAAALSQIQRSRGTPNLQLIRDYFSKLFLDRLDAQLCGVFNDPDGTPTGHGIDAAASAGNIAQFESLDRMITSEAETDDTHIDTVTDGDVFWDSKNLTGTSTIRFDRSEGEGVGQVTLPDSAGTEQAYNICDRLDDIMAQCLVYAEEPYNYVAYMSPKAYNLIKAENDPKALITDYTDARQAINGVTSTPGVAGGKVQLSALRLSDIKVPIVTVPYMMGTEASSWLWKNAVYTTGGAGNILLVNQNALEFRTLIPITYRSVPAEDTLANKHTLYMAGQLIAKNWKSHGALKYISA